MTMHVASLQALSGRGRETLVDTRVSTVEDACALADTDEVEA